MTRFTVAGIPLITSVSRRLRLKAILSAHLPPTYGNETIPVVDTLMLLLCNITLGRQPLYELGQWVGSIDPNCFELQVEDLLAFNDDRFARALDKLYLSDRASLMTEIVVNMIKEVDLALTRIHRRFNDGKGLWENTWQDDYRLKALTRHEQRPPPEI